MESKLGHATIIISFVKIWVFTKKFVCSLTFDAQKRFSTTRLDKHGRVVLVPLKSDAKVRFCTVAYTGQVTFYKIQENKAMYNWSSCR